MKPVNGVSVNLLAGSASSRAAGLTVLDEILNVENVRGTWFNDIITGNHLANSLQGGGGNDRIDGQGGNDGISGGYGSDITTGGSGSDYFYFADVTDSSARTGVDRIMDFERGIDRIVLTDIDANLPTVGDQAFVWRGMTNVFTGSSGELHFYHSTNSAGVATTTIRGDTNGDRVADVTINLQGHVWLAEPDFLL